MRELRPSQWLAVGAGAAAAAFAVWKWGDGNPAVTAEIAVGYVSNLFARGRQLSSSSLDAGVVVQTPDELAAQAAIVLGRPPSRDALALARMGRSEGVDGMELRMHVALNDLDDLQARYGTGVYSDLEALMTHSKVARADGHFSEQALGKRYATTRDPFEGDYALALKVLTDRENGIDLVDGATKFVDKSSFKAQPGATGDYDSTVAAWAAEGYVPVNVDGASSDFIIFRRAA